MNLTRTTAIGRYAANELLDGYGAINTRFGESNRDPNQLAQIVFPNRPTILSNRDDSNNTIAIYDTRSKENLYMENSTGSTQMLQDLQQMNREKVVFEGADLMPRDSIPQFNLGSYEMERISTSPISPYFEFTKSAKEKPTLIDSRILQHTNDREYAEESSQINNALNLAYSPARYEMLERQNEADRRLLGEPVPMNRYIENANAYVGRDMNLPSFAMMKETTKRLEEDQFAINQGNSYFQTAQDRDFKLALLPIPNSQTNELKSYNQLLSGNEEMLHSRYNNLYTWNDNSENIQESYRDRMRSIEILENKLEETYKRFYKTSIPKQKYLRNSPEKSEVTYFNNSNPYEQNKYYHSYSYIDRELNSTAPPIEGTPASTLINEFGERSMILDAGANQLILIQKLSPNRIFVGDARAIDDDLLISYLPEEISHELRNRINYSEGRQFKEISLNDFREITDFVNQNPGLQQRAKIRDIYSIIGDSDIDRRMLDEFSGNHVFVDNQAYINQNIEQEQKPLLLDRDLNTRREEIPFVENSGMAYFYESPELRGKVNVNERNFQEIHDREIKNSLLLPIASKQDQSLTRDFPFIRQIGTPSANFSRVRRK